MAFVFERLKIPDVVLVKTSAFPDERGYLMETYKHSQFAKFGISFDLSQDICSLSKKGVIRGLHYQLNPTAQGKLVRVLSGSILFVAVDIRKGSKSFGKWVGANLSDENHDALWVPEGFASGFATLGEKNIVYYKMSAEYSGPDARGILWNDPAIGIDWPVKKPIISEKDTQYPLLKDAEMNFVYKEGR